MDSVVQRLKTAEKECQRFEQKLMSLKNTLSPSDIAEFENLQTENAKLKYRIGILERSFLEEPFVTQNDALKVKCKMAKSLPEEAYLASLLYATKELFTAAIRSAYPNLPNLPISVTQCTMKSGDYQCNSAMQIIKKVKDEGISLADGTKLIPVEIAENIVRHIPKNDVFGSVTVAYPGFINVTIDPNYICRKVRDLLVFGIHVKSPNVPKRVIVDYSSPNIAKEMHVGHLRSTIIGDCIARIFEFLGDDVLRINHVGDWGTQFGMLLAHLVEKYPDFLKNPPPISDLQAFYKEAKARFDSEEDFKTRAYECVVRLQAKECDMIKAWQQICEISRLEFNKIYEILGIDNLEERGESFYSDLMIQMVNELFTEENDKYRDGREIVVMDDGRKVIYSLKTYNHLLLVKSDGGFTYDTSDLACLKYRVNEQKAEKIIYVTDKGQQNHFDTLFDCAAQLGYYDAKVVDVAHVGFGVVTGDDKKKFKTRSGDTVRLFDLLEEGMQRSLKKLEEKGRHQVLTAEELKAAQHALAVGCIKYADLSHDLSLDYQFSFDRMLDDRGNTAVYLLYSLTRIRSIIRKANLSKTAEEMAQEIPALKLQHARELRLAKYVLKFPEIVYQIANDLRPHTLCSYLFDLSVVFSEFYEQCYCIEKVNTKEGLKLKANIDRILLCEATANVMTTALNILGIKTLSKM